MLNKVSIKSMLIIFLIAFALGALVMYFHLGVVASENIKGVQTAVQQSPAESPYPCTEKSSDEIQGLDKALEKVKDNPFAMEIVRMKCASVWDVKKAKLDNTGKENLIFFTSAQGCGSCHGVDVHILSGEDVLFEESMSDPIFELTTTDEGKQGFSIIQPLRKRLEGLCCPTWGVKTFYEWSPSTSSFWGYDEEPYKYKEEDYGILTKP